MWIAVCVGLVFLPSIYASRRAVVIFQEQAKLAHEIAAWEKECADQSSQDKTCLKKRDKLIGELREFVALINDELDVLRQVSPNAPDDFVKETEGRRKVMEFEVRDTLYIIKCLGVSAAEPQCSAEAAAIEKEKAVIETEYKATLAEFRTSGFDGKWLSLRVDKSAAREKP
jgi:hypothetical protein